MKDLFTLEFWKFIIPLSGIVVAWFWNERRKRAADDYVRKEKKYEALIEALRGFYDIGHSADGRRSLKEKFLLELNKMWLYCPDKVMQKAYAFLATVHTDKIHSDAEKEGAVGELMLAIRQDLLSRKATSKSKLKPEDFKHLRVT
jgi:hypothetical protein